MALRHYARADRDDRPNVRALLNRIVSMSKYEWCPRSDSNQHFREET